MRSASGPGKGVGFELGWTKRAPRNMPRSPESEDSDRHRRRQEERERRKNREAVEERKRQWETVDSPDEASPSDDASSRRGRKRRKSKSKHRKKSSRRPSRSRSRSADDDTDDSRSRSRDRKKSKKSSRSRKRSSKDRKKRRHKSKSSHQKKKHRKDEGAYYNNDDASYSSSSLSDNELQILERNNKSKQKTSDGANSKGYFGKFGVINLSDFHSNTAVKHSFERWLAEVKGIASFSGPKYELHDYFKDYAEDYNTATLPHKKYYNYEKWEMEEYARKKREAQEAAAGKEGGADVALDELRHREEMAERAKRKKREEQQLLLAGMTAEKREEMKNQARLRHEMNVAYKTGDDETRKRLERRLAPEVDQHLR